MEKQHRRGGGGPAAAGGYNFQAAVTTIAMAYALRGASLGWLEGLVEDAPVSVAAETGGAGDDVRLKLAGGEIIEAQAKRRLKAAGDELWDSLLKLSEAISRADIDYGVLVLGPSSSRSIADELAGDLIRLGEGKGSALSDFGAEFLERLQGKGLDPRAVGSRLRIVTVAAQLGKDGDIKAARAELGHVCAQPSDSGRAWDRLYRDACLMMERRGARSRVAMAQVLRSAGVALRADAMGPPAALLERLCQLTAHANATFSILGVKTALSIDTAWLPLMPVVSSGIEADEPPGLAAAINRYHAMDQGRRSREASCVPQTLGRFYRHSVVVAGPGMGKSTLLTKLARAYAQDGFPVLKVSAGSVARRMAASGVGFWEAVLALGLDGSGITPGAAQAAGFTDWVVLLDGLDEAAALQRLVTEGATQLADGHPEARVIATTRPVGYRHADLASWRHYELLKFGQDEAPRHLAMLLDAILAVDDPRRLHLRAVAEEALELSEAGRAAARSPLLLALSAALLSHGEVLGRTRADFYKRIFGMIEDTPPPRAAVPPASRAVLGRFLDLLGWTLTERPNSTLEPVLEACASALGQELGHSDLRAKDLAESCLAYWEALGLLERLHEAGDTAVTFIHKTFGEYAAGRYVAALSPVEQADLLREKGQLARWREPIAFAAALGRGAVFVDALLEQGFDGPGGQERLLQALEIVQEQHPPLDDARIARVLSAAIARAQGDHRTWALQVGLALATIGARFPHLIAPQVRPLRDATQPWARLVGWAAAVESEPENLTVEAMVEALEKLATDSERGEPLHGGITVRKTDRELLQEFALRVAAIVLDRTDSDDADRLIHQIFLRPGLNTIGIVIRLQRMLDLRGMSLRWLEGLGAVGMELAMPSEREIVALQRVALTALLSPLVDSAEPPPRETCSKDSPLYALAGFLSLLKLGEAPATEVWAFKEFSSSADVREVWWALARLGHLPLDQLVREAQELIQEIKDDPEPLSLVFRRTPVVDLPPPAWALAKTVNVDLKQVETALHRPSALVVEPALNLILSAGSPTDWRAMAERLLATGSGHALWAGTELAAALPRMEGLDLLFARAIGPSASDLAHVFKGLAQLAPPDDPRWPGALTAALLGQHADVANAAAEWAALHALKGSEDLLCQAFEYWRRAEEPYPKERGTVPSSPRAALLKALVRLRRPAIADLLPHLKDSRPDVRKAAEEAILAKLDDTADRAIITDTILRGGFPADLVRDLLKHPNRFDAGEVRRLAALLEHPKPHVRLAAMPLLRSLHYDAESRREALARLRVDPHPAVREAAETEFAA